MSVFSWAQPSRGAAILQIFLIAVKAPRVFRKKSHWFYCKKISQKMKYLNFKCEQIRAKDIYSSDSVGFTNLRMPNAKNFAGSRGVSGNQA